MARKLSTISNNISRYLQKNYPRKKIGQIKFINQSEVLTPSMKVAFIRGKAFLFQSFFDSLERKHILDLESQHHIFNSLVEDKKHIRELAMHSKLVSFFDISSSDESFTQACFIAYCIVLFDSINRKNIQLQKSMTTGFIDHYYPMLYPEKNIKKDSEFYRKELTTAIRKKWHVAVSIKESFTTTEDSINFKLVAHAKDFYPTILIEKKGKRLKPTRLNAYQDMLKNLDNDFYKLTKPVERQLKKSDEVVPLSS